MAHDAWHDAVFAFVPLRACAHLVSLVVHGSLFRYGNRRIAHIRSKISGQSTDKAHDWFENRTHGPARARAHRTAGRGKTKAATRVQLYGLQLGTEYCRAYGTRLSLQRYWVFISVSELPESECEEAASFMLYIGI